MTESMTVLGLGPMGFALAEAFVQAGHATTVWNRTASRPAPDGATRAGTVRAAVTASEVVVVCLMDYDATRAVLTPVARDLAGRHVVNLTSGSPDAARELAAWAREHGITYTDGAIMTPTATIGTPAATVLHSGHPTGALAALGGTRSHLGEDPGRAAAYDVALLDLFWTSVSGMVHAFALARSEDIAPSELAPLAKGIADLMASVIDEHSARLEEGRYDGDYSNLHSAAAAMAHIAATARARGLDASVIGAAHALARRAVDAGHGTDGVSRLTVALEEARATR
jgi:3-hydroxyisobutyrate dehydrogenase-like beta-hydroxyacid dehydrogenase